MTAEAAQATHHTGGGHELIRRIRLVCAASVSALIFWHVGWWVVGPVDPQGPVTLLLINNGVVAMAEMLGLTLAASGLAVAICGAGQTHRGPFAVAVGLAALAARGDRLDALVTMRIGEIAAATSNPPYDTPFPRTELIAETWLWLALIAVGFVVGRWVESWFSPEPAPSLPVPATDSAVEIRQGLGATVLISLVAYNVIRMVAGRMDEPILLGQVYFAVGGGFLASTLLAQWCFRPVSRVWSVIAVALVATAGYLLDGPTGTEINQAVSSAGYLVLRPAARPLPVEYAALGVAGALIGYNACAKYFPRSHRATD